jgi:type IV pilus assembly protein PilM
MKWFNRKSERILGIDISTAAIKLLELSKSADGYKVESYAVRPIPEGVLVNNDPEDMEIISETIREVLKQADTKIRSASIAIAESDVFRKVITLPSGLSDAEMEEQIIIDADQYIPYPLDEVRFDFEVLTTDTKIETSEVLLVASRMENIDERVAILELAGVITKVIDLETFVMVDALSLLLDLLPNKGGDQTTAIIDIGASIISLNVVRDGQSIYARDQTFGGRQLTEEIQRIYGYSFEEAGRAKKSTNAPEGYNTEALEPFKRAIVQQIARALQVFYSSAASDEIDSIVFSGGCASIEGIAGLVEIDQKCPVLIADPFLNMKVAKKVNAQSLHADGPALMVACGLALRSFD